MKSGKMKLFVLFAVSIGLVRVSSFAVDKLESASSRQSKEQFTIAARLLKQANVPFEPDILRMPDWKIQLGNVFATSDGIPVEIKPGTRLHGVYFADTIVLGEQSTLEDDTVFVAKRMRFIVPKKHDTVVLRGPHRYFRWVLETTEIVDVTGQKVKDPKMVVDVSGRDGSSGVAGATGRSGEAGRPIHN